MFRKIFIITVVFFAVLSVHAQHPLLNKYRKMSLDYDQVVRSASLEVEGAEALKKAAKSDYYPRLDFQGNYDYIGNEIRTEQYPEIEGYNNFYDVNLYLTQPIYTGGNIKNTYKAAELEQLIAEDYSDLSIQDILLQTDEIYWSAVATKESVDLTHQYRQTIENLVSVIQDRVEEEVISREDLVMSQVQLNSAELLVLKAENELAVRMMNLNRITGQPIGQEIEIDALLDVAFTDYDNNDLVSRAFNQRPELQASEKAVELNETFTKITASKYLPQFGVGVLGLYGSPSYDLEASPDFNYGAFAKLDIPLFYWGKKKKEVMARDIQTDIAQLNLERTRDFVSLQVNEATYWLNEAVDRVKLTQNSLTNADENLEVISDRYNEGLTSILAVLDAQFTWQLAYSDYIDAKLNYLISWSKFKRALGELAVE